MKSITRFFAAILALGFALVFASGCAGDEAGGEHGGRMGDGIANTSEEFVYIAQKLEFSDSVKDIHNIVYHDGKVYFAANDGSTNTGSLHSEIVSDKLYSMKIVGSEFMELPNYTPMHTSPDESLDQTRILHMVHDKQGSLWVVEEWFFFYSESDGSVEVADKGCAVRKLDSTGAELLSFDIGSIQGHEQSSVRAFTVESGEDNGGELIYLAISNYPQNDVTVYLVDNTGKVLSRLDTESDFDRFIQMPDGSVSFPLMPIYASDKQSQTLQVINSAARTLGEKIELPDIGLEVFEGGGRYDILISDGSDIYGYIFNDGEAMRLLSWHESNFIASQIRHIGMTDDERIICLSGTWRNKEDNPNEELFLLTQTPRSELPEQTVLTLASLGYVSDPIKDAIALFNKENLFFRIEIADYSQFNTGEDHNAGQMILNTEIISGKIPDLFYVSEMPFTDYARNGLFADLYPFIDADSEFDREDFVEAAFRTAEIDGKLYQVSPSFLLLSVAGKASIVGTDSSWDMETFTAILDEHNTADIPFGSWMSKMTFLISNVSSRIDEFIVGDAGTARFDTPEFVQLLEISDRISKFIDYGDVQEEPISLQEAISSNRQIVMIYPIDNFLDPNYIRNEIFGEKVAFKGYPGSSGIALQLTEGIAIAEQSPNKDAAWTFARTFFLESWQSENILTGDFKTNQAVMDKRIESLLETGFATSFINGVPVDPPTEEDIELLRSDIALLLSLIESSSGTSSINVDEVLLDIIREDAMGYFSGRTTAQEAARVIQDRVTKYLSERS